ncbi:unnamed protein product [Trifolium pratense]|uniref:Uncharacterized protein n=1 Tax=Trifolium pratense TaxID=57577 RepID=A0ACB0IXX6_TRIPR|nr:unnamed protein product [Trifolium pratense]
MEAEHVWRVGACNRNSTLNNDNNIFNGIMLRFRPIAPKPVTGNSSTTGELTPTNTASSLPGKRTKRKYVRIRRNNGYVKKNNGNKSPEKVVETTEDMNNVAAVVTLQLMPEKETPLAGDSWCKNVDLNLTVENIQILDNPNPNQDLEKENVRNFLDLIPTAEKVVVESWITVESVTGTCMSEEGERVSRCTDVEKMKILETDTCPCFVTDGYSRVFWVNDGYKKMVLNDVSKEIEVVVWLKVKESVAWCYSYPAFTCGVRLQYTWRNEKCLKMVPCDVWRLECGGFAWRLDVKAALSLGL